LLKIKNQKGFTLIELLIVIVIIGILAGVLIAIIDPAAQQSRARDAGVQATINKVVLATQGFVSAYGRLPEGDEFLANIENETPLGLTCAAGAEECTFSVTGNILITAACLANNYSGAGAADCYYRYEVTPAGGNNFRVIARSHGVADKLFVFDNSVGEMQMCDLDITSNCAGF